MPKIPETYAIGDRSDISPERLLEIIEDVYEQLAKAVNQKPSVLFRSVAGVPTVADPADTFVSLGDINIRTDTSTVEMATNRPSSTTVTWTTL